MKQMICLNCGANELEFINGYAICKYCNSKFLIESSDKPLKESFISLQSDIEILLDKCVKDPTNAKKYASLILDIDPTNTEVKKYI